MPEKVHEKLSLNQVTYVFAHELCHFKRKDVLVNCFINGLVMFHWFNPVIWYMAYKMREDQEIACDANALRYIGNEQSNDYGYTLISLLESSTKARHVIGLTNLSGLKSQLKRRVTTLKMLGKSSVTWTILGLVIVIAVSLTALTNAKATEINTTNQISADNTESQKPVMFVNAVQPAKLQSELVEYARKNNEFEYSFSLTDDLPSLGYGAFLGGWDSDTNSYLGEILPEIKKEAAEFVPGNPIMVKSYSSAFTYYYLVPMLKESKFFDPIVFRVTDTGSEDKKAMLTSKPYYDQEKTEFTSRDKLFDVDGNDAINIIKKTQGVSEVPIPILVEKHDLKYSYTIKPQDLLWEFTLDGNKHLYVNQKGEVLDTDIIPWYEKYASPKYDPKKVILESNKMTRDDGWSLNIQSIELRPGALYDPTLKYAVIDSTIINNAGEDQIFMPKGTIVSITSATGKTYPVYPRSLESRYIDIQELKNSQSLTNIKTGQLSFEFSAEVDSSETSFTKVSYRDEQGNIFDISINIITEQKIAPPTINGMMEPYKITGQDWSWSVTKLEFRHSTESKFILAALGITLTSNSGVDSTFSPSGKILGITGTSGKFYSYDSPSSLEEGYASLLELKKERAKVTDSVYQPGVMTSYPEISINVNETNISNVIYQDENGKEYEIPLSGISPINR